VWAVHAQGQADAEALAATVQQEPLMVQARLRELASLGYLRRKDGCWQIGNHFLAEWLAAEQRRREERRGPEREAVSPVGADARLIQPPAVQAAPTLVEQLNARRAQLVELELIRARELLNTPPAVLAEIRQTEQEIERLLSAVGVNA
jgi:hypothetical protein